ncbi:hypothetical protein DYH09_20940 [bacterium CPR1]|nr:hypothetical protein [bacterium CPR1]
MAGQGPVEAVSRVTVNFLDEVRSVEAAGERVEVTFWTQAAVYWLAPGPMQGALEQARQANRAVQVTFDAATCEIVRVAPQA